MVSQPPTVSVLLPTYNRAEYLEEAMRSVLEQSFGDLELIVIDDGSTDDSGAMLDGLRDPRLRVVHQAHAGLTAALNAGLKIARGRYIARNDSDDVWLPDLLAVLVPALAAHGAAGFVYARCAGMHADGTPSTASRGGPLRDPADPFCSLLYADYTALLSTLYRRTAVEQVGGYDPSVEMSEDWDLALRVAREFPAVFVDRVVARFRQHAGNATALHSPDMRARLVRRRRVLDKVFACGDLPPNAQRMRPIAYRNLHLGSALQLLAARDYGAAASALAEAYRAGGNPLTTSARALWCATLWFGVGRWRPLADAAAAVLRRARRRRGADPRLPVGPAAESAER
jgi:glycosyltransferase involved in cell wall biosynthesis